ncbi:MAG: hypothetical protein ABFS46_14715, partial [Myxococcota bacterium]
LTGCLGDAFDEVRTRATAHALRESAYVLWKSERESEARACLAAARSFDADGPEANPVARALLEQMLAPVLESLAEEGEPSLLVKGEAGLIAKP